MHFWIDKRSQSCGFGRARVAASLSGGSGIGFGHHPRRIGGKSMVPPIHRYPPVEYRPGGQQQQQQQQQQQHHNHYRNNTGNRSSSAHATTNPHPNPHSSSSRQQQHRHPNAAQQSRHLNPQYPAAHHHHPATTTTNTSTTSSSSLSSGASIVNTQFLQQLLFQRPSTAPAAVSTAPAPNRSTTINIGRAANELSAAVPLAAHRSIGGHPVESLLPIGYFGPHTIDMEHGSLAVASTSPASAAVPIVAADVAAAAAVATSVQLLPGHLKCGIWASLALATIFVAVFQSTGLEVLIFAICSALIFVSAFAVTLCRPAPHDLLSMVAAVNAAEANELAAAVASSETNATTAVDTAARIAPTTPITVDMLQAEPQRRYPRYLLGPAGEQQQQQQQHMHPELVAQNATATQAIIGAPPPPYHIAILLPDVATTAASSADNHKDNANDGNDDDETPPPSYDKLIV